MAKQVPQRALVTGASSGMGAALSRRLAARGIEVWLAARRADRLADQVKLIEADGGRAHALTLDVADIDATVARLQRLDDEVGGIDIVVANAGIGGARGAQPMSRCPWPDVRDMLQINLMGAVATVTPFIPRMLQRGHGQIVGISSLGADLPIPQSAPYGASKAGLTFFLESIDIELRARGVAVTIVHPGFVRTSMLADLSRVEGRQPFSVGEQEAARIIDRAIMRRARLVRFPWILSTASWAVRKLPRWLSDPLVRRTMARSLSAQAALPSP
ncbi:MAG TPA: SDR family NAD(P)-dependent oxidoreductase [Polyangia bacterium]|nr:SDR family NAD(P)-dependent oxidoreductase [Polyangia bacterium]